ncbi:DUF2141 domain-containing protein [Sandarakinorhabdus sp. AAP62]|uniref:DUF2141 domain-containing protein n=1 Tax=Sandarakinorhabdus sp. AAP62 TaxID=1248916 RepID=UPI000305D5E7|nr:DUF2141 domain-containing protein [Sandarakinorhabdus sp. AAP62]
MTKIRLAALLALAPFTIASAVLAQVESNPNLGKAEGQCRAGEAGPAVLITAVGLKDRRGVLRAELYPDNDKDFLQDDNILINEGKTFRRVEMPVPASGAVTLCIRTPGPGAYTLSLLHDRDANRKFGLSTDGVGFPGNPRLGLSKPKAAAARFQTGPGLTPISIRLNYRKGLLSFGPLRERD